MSWWHPQPEAVNDRPPEMCWDPEDDAPEDIPSLRPYVGDRLRPMNPCEPSVDRPARPPVSRSMRARLRRHRR